MDDGGRGAFAAFAAQSLRALAKTGKKRDFAARHHVCVSAGARPIARRR